MPEDKAREARKLESERAKVQAQAPEPARPRWTAAFADGSTSTTPLNGSLILNNQTQLQSVTSKVNTETIEIPGDLSVQSVAGGNSPPISQDDAKEGENWIIAPATEVQPLHATCGEDEGAPQFGVATQEFFHFGFRLCEFVLPNDQFACDARRLDRSEPFEDIERHAGHSD